jgi:hypothetical protein
MNFALEFHLDVDGKATPLSAIIKNLDAHRAMLSDVHTIEGKLVLTFNGKATEAEDYSDPMLRLVDGWLRKVPWVLGGDTETVPLRNSEYCYAFIPTGNAVEISFYEGDSAEIDEYVLEPRTVLLDAYAPASLRLGNEVADLIRTLDATLLTKDEDCKDFMNNLNEANKAWREYQRAHR